MYRYLEARILQILDDWEQAEGSLPEVVEFYRKVLLIQYEAKTSLDLPILSNQLFQERLSQGIPLVSFNDLDIVQSALSDLFSRIFTLIEKRLLLPNMDMDWLRNMASDDTLLYQTARDWYDDTDNQINYRGVDGEVVEITMQAILWPWLTIIAESLLTEVDTAIWRKPYCPICGGKPDFAYLAADDGSRWLSCFRCDSEWLFQRLECPFCGNTQQNELSYYTNDIGRYRIDVCHKCKTFLKAIDLRKAEGEVLIPLEKVKTLDLWCQGQDSFRPGWL